MQDADGSALFDFASTLYDLHLSESVDACIRARRFSTAVPGLRRREHRFAIASVIHGYAGLEAVANIFKFELFDSNGGRFRLPLDKDDVALNRLLDDWDWIAIEKRYKFLLAKRGKVLAPSLENSISEVRRMRHLLAHGHAKPGLILYDGVTRRFEVEVLYDDLKFSHLKFSQPDRFTHADARRALEVILRSAHQLANSIGHTLHLTSYEIDDGGTPLVIGGGAETGPVETILGRLDSAA